MSQLQGVILAAGLGKRMKSQTPKVLHEICGHPILLHIGKTLKSAGISSPIVVSPPYPIDYTFTMGQGYRYVVQNSPGGTAEALLVSKKKISKGTTDILCVNGDCPLLSPSTVNLLYSTHKKSNADITFLTSAWPPQKGLGRVIRNESNQIIGVVEEHLANEEQIKINEVNGGIYCLKTENLWRRLEKLVPSKNGELFLPDLIATTVSEGGEVNNLEVDDPNEILGVNTRSQLANAETLMRERIRLYWMNEGVTLFDPASVFIDSSVIIGTDTTIYPNTHIIGEGQIGKRCKLGPNTMVMNSVIGDECTITSSMVSGSFLGDRSDVGPFSNIRPGSRVSSDVHIGTSVELKESRIGKGTKIGHFSYIGNARLGSNVNIGAGTVTCNFDGRNKHTTIVEDEAFIGSGTMIIPPITIGKKASTGAGSVVNRDVLPGQLVFGNPAKSKKDGQDPN